MNVEKLQKLWNLATRNPNENEALVAARKFVRAINREQVSVHLYKGSPPASQEDIQRAINNAYQKGINDIKAEYQRELDRNLNAKYNEGYLDGQRNAYTEDDMRKQYQKGYAAGQNSKAIQKSEPSDIVQDKQNTKTIAYGDGFGTSTGTVIFHNQSTGTIHIRPN
tara:strand:+ start:1958 stop:2455 length:498 start_codon:yes stop_codon:yes gene_type:complete